MDSLHGNNLGSDIEETSIDCVDKTNRGDSFIVGTTKIKLDNVQKIHDKSAKYNTIETVIDSEKLKLREEMETLAILEFSNGTNNYKAIGQLLSKYVRLYPNEKWLTEFRSSYLSKRHMGFSEQAEFDAIQRKLGRI